MAERGRVRGLAQADETAAAVTECGQSAICLQSVCICTILVLAKLAAVLIVSMCLAISLYFVFVQQYLPAHTDFAFNVPMTFQVGNGFERKSALTGYVSFEHDDSLKQRFLVLGQPTESC
jgi:hypothetical protein